MKLLASTAGANIIERIIVRREKIDQSYILGKDYLNIKVKYFFLRFKQYGKKNIHNKHNYSLFVYCFNSHLC